MIIITREDPRQDTITDFLRELDAFNAALYPPEANHHLDSESLRQPDIHFFVARDGTGALLGTGALRVCLAMGVEPAYGEVKRMYVTVAARGSGVGHLLLTQVEATARELRLPLLRLETGVDSHGALALYGRAGFQRRPAFGDYPDHPLSAYMEKVLTAQ